MRTLLIALALAASACGHSRSDSPAATVKAGDHYSARGKVTALPTSASREIEIHHERLATFKTEDGKLSPMMSMPMPFGVSDAVSVDGLAVGDVVQFSFDVRWTGSPALMLTQIAKLPADTKLVLE